MEKQKRQIVAIDKDAHQEAKVKAAINKMSLKDYLASLIRRDKVDWEDLQSTEQPE